MATEETKKLLEDMMIVTKNTFMSSEEKPSKEQLFKILCDQFGDRLLRLSKQKLNKVVDGWIEQTVSLSNLQISQRCFPSSEDLSNIVQRYLKKASQKTVTKACEGVKKKAQEGPLPTSIAEFVDFLYDFLTECFDDQVLTDLKAELLELVGDLTGLMIEKVDQYVSEELIPKLSYLIINHCKVSLEKQLTILKPFFIQGLKVLLKEGKMLNKKEIISMAKRSLPECITTTVIPNATERDKKRVTKVLISAANSALEKGMTADALANSIPTVITEIFIPDESEESKKLLECAIIAAKEIIFSPGTTPSVEQLFTLLPAKFGDTLFCYYKEKLEKMIDDLLEEFPDEADAAVKFVLKHVLPLLSVQFYPFAYVLIDVFLKDSFRQIISEGTIKRRKFIKPTGLAAIIWCAQASKPAVAKALTKTIGTRQASNEVIKKVSTEVVTKKTAEVSLKITKTVAGKTTQKTVTKVTQKMAVKVSAKVAADGTKTVAAQASKVTKKAAAKVSTSKVAADGTKTLAAQASKVTKKAATKVSTKVTADGTQTVASQVTKKAIKRVEGVTTTTTKKVTMKSTQLTKTSTKLSEKISKEGTKQGLKSAATAGLSAAGISAVVGGVFLYCNMKDLNKQKKKNEISELEYSKKRRECIGECAGDVIGAGVVGAAVSVAALTGPVGWAAIGAGAIVSWGFGKLGGYIGQRTAT